MLRNIKLKPSYNSKGDNLGVDFYDVVLKNCIIYKRASAYFSAKALAHYSKGLENFSIQNGKFQLVINHQVEEDDFLEMKLGLSLKEKIRFNLKDSLNEKLELDEMKRISNLAFLIANGNLEIKIAFMSRGIFHDKFGFFIDENKDVIYFRGSNNETEAAISINYESFDISCSWLSNDFDKEKIQINFNEFERIWNNEVEDLLVLDIDDVVKNEILKFNKGSLIFDGYDLLENTLILDLDESLHLELNCKIKNIESIVNNTYYVFEIKRYVSNFTIDKVIFRENLTYIDFKNIIKKMEILSVDLSLGFIISKKLNEYISEKDYFIESRRNLGISIKNRELIIQEPFQKFKVLVDSVMTRKLRDQQMWDAFFMYSIKKSSNFSVPGSGKTASVLGVYAFLREVESVKRIVVVGPKNSFESWIVEYENCFSQKPIIFNWQDSTAYSTKEKIRILFTETGGANLILINYEALPTINTFENTLINKHALLVFDEVHKIKRVGGVYAEHAKIFSKNANTIIGLTGTPIPNSYLDIYNLINILYRDEYKTFFAFSVESLYQPREKTIKDINNKLFPFFCRTSKDSLSVPKPNQDIELRTYSSNLETLVFEYLKKKYKKNKLGLLIRILQLESNPKLLLTGFNLTQYSYLLEDIEDVTGKDETISGIENKEIRNIIEQIDVTTKVDFLINNVVSLAKAGKNVIVWCIFVDSIMNITARLNEKMINCNYIIGETDQDERRKRLDDFRESRINVLVTNPHTLAESVSLHKHCHDAVYFEFSYNLVHLLQSKDRIHRLGLSENQYTQYFYCINNYKLKENEFSLNKRIYERLLEKEKVMIDAIDKNKLEVSTTSEEDLELIFNNLF